MSVTVEDITATKKRVKIEIPADVVAKEYETSLKSVRQRARIPGFRPGHAPANMIEKRFGGDIRSDLIDKLVPDYYTRALREHSLVPVAMPTFESTPEIRRNEPVTFTVTVEVRPKIENLRYTGLQVDAVPVSVEEREVDETLASMQEQRAVFNAVDREVREDDLIVMDYVQFDPSGEKEIGSAKDKMMRLSSQYTPQGILDEVLGRRSGDVVDIVLPVVAQGEIVDESGQGERLRITIKEVKEKKLPPIDGDFAKDFGHDTLEALKEKIREGLMKAKQDDAARQQKATLVDELVSAHEFEVPETMLRSELATLVNREKEKRTPPAGQAPQQDDAAADDAALGEELRPRAVRNVMASLLLDAVSEREGIVVTEEELRTRIALLAKSFQATPEAVVNLFMTRDGSLDGLRHTIREEKAMDLLLAKAQIVQGAS